MLTQTCPLGTVPTAPPPGQPVLGLQLPRVCAAPDEGLVPREQGRRGPPEGAGARAEGAEGLADAEGALSLRLAVPALLLAVPLMEDRADKSCFV